MSIFKLGDTVERINTTGPSARVGQRGVVVNVDRDGDIYVKFPGCVPECLGGECWLARNSKLVQPSADLNFKPIRDEKARTYIFPDGTKYRVEGVSALCVRPSNHRLETHDGRRLIVSGKFIAIEIEADAWSA